MRLLKHVAWNFTGKGFDNRADFNQAIANYQLAILDDPSGWNPDEIIVSAPEVDILYECYATDSEPVFDDETIKADYGEEKEIIARFTADNGASFSALELLYKLHQRLQQRELGDHTFFEGLVPADETEKGQIPLFEVRCGS